MLTPVAIPVEAAGLTAAIAAACRTYSDQSQLETTLRHYHEVGNRLWDVLGEIAEVDTEPELGQLIERVEALIGLQPQP